MAKILALDYGTKYIGIAISDDSQTFAFPRQTLKNTSFEEVFKHIDSIVKSENVEKILLGEPWHLNGADSDFLKNVRQFGKELSKKSDLPIHFQDERLSTEEAHKKNKERGAEILSRKDVNALAAQIILQNFLNSPTSKKNLLKYI